MIIYIYGEDTFRSHEYLKDQVIKFKTARDPQGYNVVFLDCAKAEAGKVMSEIVSAPFLAEKRMVVVENVLSSSDKGLLGELIGRVQAVATPSVSPLERGRSAKSFPESNVIVFYQSGPLSKVKEAKELDALLKKEKYAMEFDLLTGDKLAAWIESKFKKFNRKISKAAILYLVANTVGDMWHLETLTDQLVAYKNSEIQLADVELFLEEKIDDNIFALIDAIVAGNQKVAFKLLENQRKLGAEDGQIFGTILWQFRILLSMRDLFESSENSSSEIMAKTLKIHPFVAKKNWAIMKKYPKEKLRLIYKRFLDIDIKTKTGFADQSILLDLFVGSV